MTAAARRRTAVATDPEPAREPTAAGAEGPVRWVTSRPLEIAIGVALFAAAVLLPLLKQTGVHTWDTIWAEDGPIYVDDVTKDGGFAVLFRGYAGYLQLSSRVLALPTAIVPARSLALYLVGSAALVSALLALFVYYAAGSWVASRPVRIALASLVVLQPALGYENIGSITNTIWTFAAVLPWALVSTAERKTDVALRGGVAFVAVGSTALGLFFLPLGLIAALYRRTLAAWTVFGIYAAGCALQLGVMTHTKDQPRPPIVNSPRELGNLIGLKVYGMFLVGAKGVASLWIDHGRLFAIGAVVVVLVLLLVCLPGVDRAHQGLAILFVGCAMLLYAAPLWARGTANANLVAGVWTQDGSRYSVIPTVLLGSAFAVLVAPVGRGYARAVARWARPIFIAQIAVVALLNFSIENPRSEGPVWTESVAATAAEKCVGVPPDTLVGVPITPLAWGVQLPCSKVRG